MRTNEEEERKKGVAQLAVVLLEIQFITPPQI